MANQTAMRLDRATAVVMSLEAMRRRILDPSTAVDAADEFVKLVLGLSPDELRDALVVAVDRNVRPRHKHRWWSTLAAMTPWGRRYRVT